jgi:hypothetical protein
MLENVFLLLSLLLLVAGGFYDFRALGEPKDPRRTRSFLDLWLQPDAFNAKGRRFRSAAMIYYIAGTALLLAALWI